MTDDVWSICEGLRRFRDFEHPCYVRTEVYWELVPQPVVHGVTDCDADVICLYQKVEHRVWSNGSGVIRRIGVPVSFEEYRVARGY